MSQLQLLRRAVSVSALVQVMLCLGVPSARGDIDKLPEAASDDAKKWAVVFDFDKDSCYPSPAVSPDGTINGGLRPRGGIVGECRAKDQLDSSNTYYRRASVKKDGVEYAVHMYALYFKKDQAVRSSPVDAGHRHDWEFALVWTKDGELTHASCSAHGNVTTYPKAELHFDKGKENNVKVVYHKDDRAVGIGTHAFRFAKPDEEAENEAGAWVTPTIVDWETMKGDKVSNAELRKKLNEHDFGEANCSFNDNNFAKEVAKQPPEGYPAAEEWRRAAQPR